MGGRLTIVASLRAASSMDAPAAEATTVRARRVARLIDAWSARLTRFDEASELMRLNRDPRPTVAVGPTLAAVLEWARMASAWTDGLVDVTLLRQRLAAEAGVTAELAADRSWNVVRRPRGAVVQRAAGLTFDLDGVAKGWLADRALAALGGLDGALVDADGDIAIRVAPGDDLAIGVADPRSPDRLLATLRLDGGPRGATFGVATSGTSVHRWPGTAEGASRHHLIDPRTGRPAATDLVQVTVLARTAAEAEVLAKAAAILGSAAAVTFLEERRAHAAVLLTTGGACIATPASLPWLEAA
jgi:thiamine biosynthesis lipoprotein